jgi:hypothetical protein
VDFPEFKAIVPDSLDSYTRSQGLLTKANNLAYAKMLVASAHQQQTAFAQKNDPTITKAEATDTGFDFAIVEDCQVGIRVLFVNISFLWN